MSGLDIGAHYVAARWRAATLHGNRLAEWQERRARDLVDYVRARSAFHRRHWHDLPTRDWRRLPTVDKAMMMADFDHHNTLGIARDAAMQVALTAERDRDFSAALQGCTVGMSSGTSGHRGLFLVSPSEQTRWAGTILARAIPDLRPGHRVAFFLRANSRLYERTSSVVQFRFFDLLQPLDAMLATLNTFRPQLVVGPPSLLGMLADAREAGTLHASPTRLVSVAEVLEPHDRARIEATFQAPVGEVYQCTEGLVAVSCRHGLLHVQEDVMVLQQEPIDDDAERVTPILTDLWRRAQPIVRYRLGDILRLDATPCRCGSSWQRIAAIEGRQDDLCWFPQVDDSLRAIFPDAIRRMVLLADDRIVEYRAEQAEAGGLTLQIALRDDTAFADVAERLQHTVRAALAEYGCHAVSVRVEQGVPPLPAGSKRRRVVCSWRHHATATATALA
ncbi:MAG: F390 synthetase-related protein [Gemmatimonadota bacterium]